MRYCIMPVLLWACLVPLLWAAEQPEQPAESTPAGAAPVETAEEEENVFTFGESTIRIEGPYSSYFVNETFFRIHGAAAVVYYVKEHVAVEITAGQRSRERVPVPPFARMTVTFEKGGAVKTDIDGKDPFKEYKDKVVSAGAYLKKNQRFDASGIKTVVTRGLIQPLIVQGSRKRTVLIMRLDGFEEDFASIETSRDGRSLLIGGKEWFQPQVTLRAPEKTALTFRECSGGQVNSSISAVYVYADDMGEYRAGRVDNANIYTGGEVTAEVNAKGSLVIEAAGESVCNATFGTSAQVVARGAARVTVSGAGGGSGKTANVISLVRIEASASAEVTGSAGGELRDLHIVAGDESIVSWSTPAQKASVSSADSAVVRVKKPAKIKGDHTSGEGTIEWLP